MGEKFSANPVTGTGSLNIPVYTSPRRSGFGPQLSLYYDSVSGNGSTGWGWDLSIPSITLKTDKGLPRYHDSDESDVFILSGAEDLVPVLREVDGRWERDVLRRKIGTDDYLVHHYRPRVEGLFALIERWTRQRDSDTYWRSISKDKVTTLYGKSGESRIADPADPTCVFSWLICESYDDKRNAILYQYVPEDSKGISLSHAHESNRTNESRSANRYLKHVKYGNRTPRQPGEDLTQRSDWLFEVAFDHGEHDPNYSGEWFCRHDPLPWYRAGFEVRTYRLCQRALMFHQLFGSATIPEQVWRLPQLATPPTLQYTSARHSPAITRTGPSSRQITVASGGTSDHEPMVCSKGALMTSNKLSSATKRLFAEASESENDRPVNLLIRVTDSLSPETEATISSWGGYVRTRAGDVVSLTLPLRHLDALTNLESVIYVEVAEPLYPESSNLRIGE